MAYLAHGYLGNDFGTVYDVSSILILVPMLSQHLGHKDKWELFWGILVVLRMCLIAANLIRLAQIRPER